MERFDLTKFEVGKKFMYNGIEYEISFINEKKKRINVFQVVNEKIEKIDHNINQIIKLDGTFFMVKYVNKGKDIISLEFI